MQKAITIGCWITVIFVLAGCGAKDITNHDVNIAGLQAQAAVDCRKSRQIDLSLVPKEHRAFAVMAQQQSETMLLLTGHDPCGQTNVYDSQIAEVRAKNETIKGLGGSVVNFGFAWLGAGVLDTALKEAGDAYTSSGFSETYVTNENESRNTSNKTEDSYNDKDSDNVISTTNESNPVETNTAPYTYTVTPSDSYNYQPSTTTSPVTTDYGSTNQIEN